MKEQRGVERLPYKLLEAKSAEELQAKVIRCMTTEPTMVPQGGVSVCLFENGEGTYTQAMLDSGRARP